MTTQQKTRITLNLDKDWRFHFGEVKTEAQKTHSDSYQLAKAGNAPGPAARNGFDDSAWRSVDLPHDYLSETDFSPENLHSHGYKTRGNGWYRKTFRLDESLRGRNLTLVFEGMSVASTVYFNGSIAGRLFSAYSELEIDITDRAAFGDALNTLAVHIDGLSTEGWWYEGAGIYRHVRLICTDPLHIAHNGLWVKPQPVPGTENDWTVELETTVANRAYDPAEFTVRAAICDGDTVLAEGESAPAQCPADDRTAVTQTLRMQNPTRWDIDAPKRYEMRVTLCRNGEPVDADCARFGFRTIAIDADKGFFLNGRPVKLKGVCCHQDHAGVGVAVPDSIQYFRVRRLKEMGVNAYRCSHNMPAKEILDACDEYGLIVMDENRRFECSPEVLGFVENMVRRDRNHPCVAFYSLFNEEPLQSTPEGRAIYRRMASCVRKLDNTRLLTGAINDSLHPEGTALEMDVTGMNYGIPNLAAIHAQFPHQPIIGSENNSAVTTRGCYRTDRDAHVLSNYDEEVVPWGQTIRETWAFTRSHDYMAGIFIWTGFDYRGEPTPFNWPSCSSQFGIMDTCGFAKDSFYQNRACFVEEPMIHLLPHWNWAAGDTVRVMTASNCTEAELFLNGRSLGRKPSDACAPCEWQVAFEPGTLRAVGYRDGRAVCADEQQTTGAPVAVGLEPDRDWIANDGADTVPVTVFAADAQGRRVPTAANAITFEVSGDGFVLGVGNGDPNCHESDQLPARSLYCGLCQALIQARPGAKTLTLTARSAGLAPATVTFTVREVPQPNYLYRTVSHAVTGVQISQSCFDERPDPNHVYADNDMNSFAALTLDEQNGALQADFTHGWRLYRLPVRVPAGGHTDKPVTLTFARLGCAEAELWLRGARIWACGTSNGDAAVIPLPMQPGESAELRLLLRARDGAPQPNGIGKCITLAQE